MTKFQDPVENLFIAADEAVNEDVKANPVEYVTVAEASQILGYDSRFLREIIKRGEISATTVDRELLTQKIGMRKKVIAI